MLFHYPERLYLRGSSYEFGYNDHAPFFRPVFMHPPPNFFVEIAFQQYSNLLSKSCAAIFTIFTPPKLQNPMFNPAPREGVPVHMRRYPLDTGTSAVL